MAYVITNKRKVEDQESIQKSPTVLIEIDLLLRCPEVTDITQMKNSDKVKQKKIESIMNHEKNVI